MHMHRERERERDTFVCIYLDTDAHDVTIVALPIVVQNHNSSRTSKSGRAIGGNRLDCTLFGYSQRSCPMVKEYGKPFQ